VIAAGNFVWEIFQLPAFADWREGGWSWLAFIVTAGTAGDLLIAGTSLALSLLAFGNRHWPEDSASYWRVAVAAGLLGLCYTAYSEWGHAVLLRYWRYSALMPVVPGLGIGVFPLLQWIVIPAWAFCWVRRCLPAAGSTEPACP
jgi:hypothetical protein